MRSAAIAKRVTVLVLTVALVLAVATAGGAFQEPAEDPSEPPDISEYDPESVVVEPHPAEGEIEVNASSDAEGVVLIDDGHNNRFSRSDIEPLVTALVSVGYEVEFYNGGDLETELETVDAFLVIDPGAEYLSGDIDDVQRFTQNGGRLVMVGEPDRVSISASLFGSSLQTQQSALTTLASRYGMSVDTQYLYNQENADANYKWIETRPARGSGLDDVETTTMYTAAAVQARNGDVLLRSAPETHKSGSDDTAGTYPVAVQRGNVMLLGDKTFMGAEHYRVADNEKFVAHVVEFLIGGERDVDTSLEDEDEDGTGGTSNSTATG